MLSPVATAQPGLKSRENNGRWSELISEVSQGDQAALGRLYDATSRTVYSLVLRIVRNPSAAEEVTLDVYSQVWRLAATYRPERAAPATWLLLLARSRAIDFLRSRIRSSQEREQPIDALAGACHPASDPEQAFWAAARSEVVQAALRKLDAEQREVLELAYFKGMSHSEIAAGTGQPLGSVKTRIRLGMLRLRDLLQPYAEGI